MNAVSKRRRNERKFGHWEVNASGGRRCWRDVPGKSGWWLRYVKDVDGGETTIQFGQEVHDSDGRLVEIHEKYPEDKGHRTVEE